MPCPLARFGCIEELFYDDLVEHYFTQIHQEVLLKAVKNYVKGLHSSFSPIYNKEDYVELLNSIEILAEGLSCLHDDNVQIHTNYVQLLNSVTLIQKQIEELNESSRATAQLLQSTKINYEFLQTNIETVKQKLTDASSSRSNDGTYIWRLANVAEKIAAAIAEEQTSLYSPPFFSSPTGYKMCMRLYLNGDGQARRTHLSLFFVLMRGDYDPILVWPFEFKITFAVLDQSGKQQHIIDSFRPDMKSNSFQRPRSDMNIASGIPKFMPLSLIEQENNPYIRDDCMFIRCIVDFASIPKSCLSYVANINPALPLSVQQEQIQTEIKKYKSSMSDSSQKTN